MSKYVGAAVPRIDAREKVTGEAKYVNDISLPRMLYGQVVRSTVPHARIRAIHLEDAYRVPGVVAVVTQADLPSKRYGRIIRDRTVLAGDKVRFLGEPVAAVAAETVEAAEVAASLVKIEYEELPAIFTLEEAMAESPRVVIHEDLPNYEFMGEASPLSGRYPNVYREFIVRTGDIERGYAEADLILENEFETSTIQHCPLEPHACVAQVDSMGVIHVWSPSQSVFETQGVLCDALGLPESRVHVIACTVGGGFGNKTGIKAEGIAAALSLKAKRPVKLCFSREEVFIGTTVRHGIKVYIKDGVKRDGRLVSRLIRIFFNGGAYASDMAYLVARNGTYVAAGAYNIPNFWLESYGVYTNLPVGGAYRGFGSSEVNWAIEMQMNFLAERLGIDPVELRLRNLLAEGQVNVMGEKVKSIGVRECLEKVRKKLRESSPATSPFDQKPWKKGRGFAIGNKYSLIGTSSSASVRINDAGTVEVNITPCEIGQGSLTALSQIAADELGCDLGDVRILSLGDTYFSPYDYGAVSSRITYCVGNAIIQACKEVKDKLLAAAAEALGTAKEELYIDWYRKEISSLSRSASVSFRQLFHPKVPTIGKLPRDFSGRGVWFEPFTPLDKDGRSPTVASYWIYGAHGVEVALNEETGEVVILRVAAAFDVGKVINPDLCRGQIEGGTVMGLGSALYEHLLLEDSKVLNPSFLEYRIPTAVEAPLPAQIHVALVEALHPNGPFGAKGLGEAAMVTTAPALGAAIHAATGAKPTRLPMTRDYLMVLLGQRGSP